jgi:hypothetical protein
MNVLVVQRGHVPRTTGATGGPGEQAMARRIARRIADYIDLVDGWVVRIIDADEPTHRYAGAAFIALHGDAAASPSAGGASVGYRNREGRELAHAWKAAYAAAGWPHGWRTDNYTAALAGYYGTRQAVAAGNPRACIVEHGFMTNPTERKWIDSDAGTEAAARAAVIAATGVDPIGDTMSPEQEAKLDRLAAEVAWVKRALGARYEPGSQGGDEQLTVGHDLLVTRRQTASAGGTTVVS